MKHFKLIKFEDIVINELLKGCIQYDFDWGDPDNLDGCGSDQSGYCETIDLCGIDQNSNCMVADECVIDGNESCVEDFCIMDGGQDGCQEDGCFVDACMLDVNCQADGEVCGADNPQDCYGGDCYTGE